MNMACKILLLIILPLLSSMSAAEKILVFHWPDGEFKLVRDSLVHEIGQGHQVIDHILKKNITYDEFRDAISKNSPKIVVLMDNISIKLWLELGTKDPELKKTFVAVGAMALNIKSILKNKTQIAGIAHEVPGFTVISRFRSAVDKPVKNILVPYRASEFGYLVEDARRSLGISGVNLIGVNVEDSSGDVKNMYAALDGALEKSYGGVPVDAIWVLNDNGLINNNTFQKIWISKAQKLNIPFLCSLKKFVSRELGFCSYAASTSHVDLGQQLGEMVLALIENSADTAMMRIEYLQSVEETVNIEMLRKTVFSLTPRAERYIKLED
ncbi:MAG: hypothetical protein HQK54_03085 [Oligoflexales bacterium]|nr:hypothetical protein [Oligoflexales bacterium]